MCSRVSCRSSAAGLCHLAFFMRALWIERARSGSSSPGCLVCSDVAAFVDCWMCVGEKLEVEVEVVGSQTDKNPRSWERLAVLAVRLRQLWTDALRPDWARSYVPRSDWVPISERGGAANRWRQPGPGRNTRHVRRVPKL